MRPIRTSKTTGIYGAPLGHEDQIGGLPYYRERTGIGDVTGVYSVWTFDEADRKAIANGANLVLGIVGMEPIPPVSLSLQAGPWVEEVKQSVVTTGTRPPKPPAPPTDREMG